MMVWKMIFLFQGCILRFHVNLPGCNVQLNFDTFSPTWRATLLTWVQTTQVFGHESFRPGQMEAPGKPVGRAALCIGFYPGRHAQIWAWSFHSLHGWFFSTLKRITNWEVFQCPKCELWSWSSQGSNHTIHLGFFMIYFRGATFWLTSLNWTLQAEKFQAVLSLLELKRTLLLLATGSGKSLCYQLPAYLCLGCHAGFSKWLDDTWDPGWTKRFESIYVWRFFVSHRLSSSRVQQRLWLVSLRYPQTKNSYIDSFTYVFWEPGSWTPIVPCWRCSWANSDKKTRWTWSLFSTLRLREEGLTLVVSPLVSLMQDQLARLPKCLFLGLSRIGSWETFFLGCAVGSGTCAAVHTCIRVGYLWLKSLTLKMSSEASIV